MHGDTAAVGALGARVVGGDGVEDRCGSNHDAQGHWCPGRFRRDRGRRPHRIFEVIRFRAALAGMRGGMDFRLYKVELTKQTYDLVTYTWPDGKIEQYLLSPH